MRRSKEIRGHPDFIAGELSICHRILKTFEAKNVPTYRFFLETSVQYSKAKINFCEKVKEKKIYGGQRALFRTKAH